MWDGGERQLYLARTDDPGARELGMKGAELLSISKNGELAIRLNTVGLGGYSVAGTLARVPLSGGMPRDMLDNVQDADWASRPRRTLPRRFGLEIVAIAGEPEPGTGPIAHRLRRRYPLLESTMIVIARRPLHA